MSFLFYHHLQYILIIHICITDLKTLLPRSLWQYLKKNVFLFILREQSEKSTIIIISLPITSQEGESFGVSRQSHYFNYKELLITVSTMFALPLHVIWNHLLGWVIESYYYMSLTITITLTNLLLINNLDNKNVNDCKHFFLNWYHPVEGSKATKI